jgi:serine/threonine-protein kinase
MTKLAGLLAVAVLLAAPAAQAEYGAIYYSQGTGAYGYAWKARTQEAAEDAAYAECRNHTARPRDCQMATWFSNACGALAVASGTGGAWAGAWGDSVTEAERKALGSCKQEYGGRNCRLEISGCADGYGFE